MTVSSQRTINSTPCLFRRSEINKKWMEAIFYDFKFIWGSTLFMRIIIRSEICESLSHIKVVIRYPSGARGLGNEAEGSELLLLRLMLLLLWLLLLLLPAVVVLVGQPGQGWVFQVEENVLGTEKWIVFDDLRRFLTEMINIGYIIWGLKVTLKLVDLNESANLIDMIVKNLRSNAPQHLHQRRKIDKWQNSYKTFYPRH